MSDLDRTTIQGLFRRGQAAFPTFTLSFKAFDSFIAHSLIEMGDLETHTADIFLVAACANQDPHALRLFENQFKAHVRAVAARHPMVAADELAQVVRVKLFVGERPAIEQYRGANPLRAWLRVVLAHTAIDLTRKTNAVSQGLTTDMVGNMVFGDNGPEVQVLKNLYGGKFRAAIAAGLESLDDADRTLLRLHFLDGLNLDALARIYHSHRATVARRIVGLRSHLLDRIREQLSIPGSPISTTTVRGLLGLFQGELISVVSAQLQNPPNAEASVSFE